MITRYLLSIAFALTPYTAAQVCIAQAPFWQPSNGPYTGSVDNLVRTPGRTLFANAGPWIFRSTNDGARWTRLARNDVPVMLFAVGSLASGTILALAPDRILWRSTDNGDSWSRIESYQDDGGVFAAGNDGVGYFAGANIWRSLDDGLTWSELNPSGMQIAVAALPVAADSLLIVSARAVHLSRDSGATLTQVGSLGFGPMYWASRLANGDLFGLIGDRVGFFSVRRSTNNGALWDPMSMTIDNPEILPYTALGPTGGDTMFVGVQTGGIARWDAVEQRWQMRERIADTAIVARQFMWADDGVLVARSDAGVFRSTDGAGSWSWSSEGLSAAHIRSMRVMPNGDVFAIDRYGVHRSTDVGASWKHLGAFALPTDVAVTPAGALLVSASNGIYRSTNTGSTWTLQNLGPEPVEVSSVIASNANALFAALPSRGIFRSMDDGVTWTLITAIDDVRSLESSFAGEIIAITVDNSVFFSRDGGDDWIEHPMSRRIQTMTAHRFTADGNVLYGTEDGEVGIFNMTTLTSHPFNVVLDGVRANYVNDVQIVPGDAIYVATGDRGVWRGGLDGTGWQNVSQGMITPSASRLALHPSGYLLAGTIGSRRIDGTLNLYGDGVVRSSVRLSSVDDPSTASRIRVASGAHSIAIDLGVDGAMSASLSLSDITGQTVAGVDARRYGPGDHRIAIPTAGLPSGVYLLTIREGSEITSRMVSVVR